MADEILAAALDIETRKYTRNMNDATKQAQKLDSALDKTMRQAAKTDKALNSINGDIDVNVDVNATQVTDAKADVKALDGSKATVTLNAVTSGLQNALDSLKNITIGAGIVGLGASSAGAGVLTRDIQSSRDAVNQFAIATGQTQEEAAAVGTIIDEIWLTGFAESKAQIAGIAAQLYQANVPMEEIGAAASNAFTIAAATGEDINEILQAQITLVKTGLTPSYQGAADLLSTGFANGLNSAGDLLDTVKEYSRDFADLGVTGETFFNILNTGLDAGAYNTDKIADALRELKIRTDTALSSGTGTEFEGLQTLGLLDEAEAYRAGTITGEQWIQAVLDTVSAENLDAVVTGAFGSPLEDLGVGVFEAINTALKNPELQLTFDSTTQTMADTLEDNIGFALNRAQRAVVTDLANSFEIAGKPLTDLLDNLPDKLNRFSDLISGGAGIPEALEIALNAPGLSEDIRQLQANLGGFIIELQLAIAGFLEGIGQGGAATGLRQSAAAGAQSQLVFDLQFLDPDQASAAIATALRRGVDESGVNTAIAEAGENLIDDDQLKRYQNILAEIQNTAFLPTTVTAGGTVSGSQLLGVDLDDVDSAKTRITEAISAMQGWRTEVSFGEIIAFDTEQLLEDAGVIETLGKRTAEADDAMIDYGASTDKATTKTDAFGASVATNFDTGANAVEDFGLRATTVLGMVERAATITQQALFDAGVDPTVFAALTFGASVDAAKSVDGSHAAGLDFVPYDGYLAELHYGERVLNASEAAAYRGGGGTNINTVNINVVQNLNAGGMAQASSAGQRFANSIRGY